MSVSSKEEEKKINDYGSFYHNLYDILLTSPLYQPVEGVGNTLVNDNDKIRCIIGSSIINSVSWEDTDFAVALCKAYDDHHVFISHHDSKITEDTSGLNNRATVPGSVDFPIGKIVNNQTGHAPYSYLFDYSTLEEWFNLLKNQESPLDLKTYWLKKLLEGKDFQDHPFSEPMFEILEIAHDHIKEFESNSRIVIPKGNVLKKNKAIYGGAAASFSTDSLKSHKKEKSSSEQLSNVKDNIEVLVSKADDLMVEESNLSSREIPTDYEDISESMKFNDRKNKRQQKKNQKQVKRFKQESLITESFWSDVVEIAADTSLDPGQKAWKVMLSSDEHHANKAETRRAVNLVVDASLVPKYSVISVASGAGAAFAALMINSMIKRKRVL